MDLEMLFNLIGNVIFPIGTTLICMWYIKYQNDTSWKERQNLIDGVNKKIDALTNLICYGHKNIDIGGIEDGIGR